MALARSLSLVPHDPELVIGLVAPIGTDLASVEKVLKKALDLVKYNVEGIKLTDLLYEPPFADLVPQKSLEHTYDAKILAGDELRKKTEMPDALGILGIIKIKKFRKNQEGGASDKAVSRQAYVLNQLKRPEEVETLRRIYGDGFILIGVYSSRQRRIANLARKFYRDHRHPAKTLPDAEALAAKLVNQDEEDDANKDYGQAVRKTFPLADVFIDADAAAKELKHSVERFVRLLFWDPTITPTRDEYAMFLAQGAAMRSADLGRQVGAALTVSDGQVLSLGTNEVAKPGGGLYWTGDESDQRDIYYQDPLDTNTDEKIRILNELLGILKKKLLPDGVAPVEVDALSLARSKDLKHTRLMSLIEFLRPVHAEMAALMDAARRGIAVTGGTLYATTFPCHECAKHLVAAGISRLVFIEPYPKSQVAYLFADSIRLERQKGSKEVPFEQFCGVAPRRYLSFFGIADKLMEKSGNVLADGRRDGNGQILDWEANKEKFPPKMAGFFKLYTDHEDIMITGLEEARERAIQKVQPSR